MSLLLLEPVGGIAGDMFLACCLGLGVDVRALEAQLQGLGVPGWTLEVTRAERHSIQGLHVNVRLDDGQAHPRDWKQIRSLIQDSRLAARVKEGALSIFQRLAQAEAEVHGVEVDEVHFHEVGAVDSMVDIVGASACLDLLGWPEVRSTAPPLGSGMVRSSHGMVPVPGPATLALLKDRPVRFEGVGELTTPTGAAILAAMTSPAGQLELIPQRIGMGMGTRELPDRPNLLRGTLGPVRGAGRETLVVTEANVDDMNPQLYGPLIDGLLALGALDAWVIPVLMKKGRPGHLVGALSTRELARGVRESLFRNSTTLGVRSYDVERTALERRFVEVKTSYGLVRVKLGVGPEGVVNAAPEFEDCRKLAEEAKAPVKDVWAAALGAYYASVAGPGGSPHA